MHKGFTLYRFFNADGELLYAGVTANVAVRFSQHRSSSSWWVEVVAVKLEWFENRDAAESAEFSAIKSEAPKYNVTYNDANFNARFISPENHRGSPVPRRRVYKRRW